MHVLALSGLLAAVAVSPIHTTLISSGTPGEHLAMHCVTPARPNGQGVLFAHGSSFPTRLAAGFEFSAGDSWLQDLASRGYFACGLDFLGFGGSSRPATMAGAADAAEPVLRAPEAARQIAVAVATMKDVRLLSALHLVAHSWGTIPAATYAAHQPTAIRSLTLFGPVVPTPGATRREPVEGAWFSMTAAQRLDQLYFRQVLPRGKTLLEPAVQTQWAAQFDASAPRVKGDASDQIRIPNGPNADVADATVGRYPYAASDVRVPVFVVYGSADTVVDDARAAPFLASFTGAPLRWRLRIDDGTHVMHLERQRHSLYEAVAAFLRAANTTQP